MISWFLATDRKGISNHYPMNFKFQLERLRVLLLPVPVVLSYALIIARQDCDFAFIYGTIPQIYLRHTNVIAASFSQCPGSNYPSQNTKRRASHTHPLALLRDRFMIRL